MSSTSLISSLCCRGWCLLVWSSSLPAIEVDVSDSTWWTMWRLLTRVPQPAASCIIATVLNGYVTSPSDEPIGYQPTVGQLSLLMPRWHAYIGERTCYLNRHVHSRPVTPMNIHIRVWLMIGMQLTVSFEYYFAKLIRMHVFTADVKFRRH